MDIYEMVVKAAEKGLEALGKTKNKNIKGNQLLEWILNNKDQFDFNVELIKVSWGAYLTRAILDPETKIAREPGKYSLILDNKKSEIVQESLTDEESNPTAKPGNIEQQSPDRQKREEILYNLLAEWLSLQKYNAEVRADSRKGCKWGNPDIVGIMLVDDPLGRQQIEIGTIEAKISLADWRKDFFLKRFHIKGFQIDHILLSLLELIALLLIRIQFLIMKSYENMAKNIMSVFLWCS